MGEPTPTALASQAPPWEEAVHSGRCPVCFLLRWDEFEQLSRWVGGAVADQQNHRRLDDAGGFCNGHFWLLNGLHSPQSGSLLNDFIAARMLQFLRDPAAGDEQAQATWLRQAAARCPVCACLRACETAHVRAFVGWLADALASGEYAESRGLCLPHLLRCRALVQDPSLREQLSQTQTAQIERLQSEMRALVRKLATGRRRDVSRDEWVAYERATEKLVGRRGLLPPQSVGRQ